MTIEEHTDMVFTEISFRKWYSITLLYEMHIDTFYSILLFKSYFIFWSWHKAYGILVPWPGIEPPATHPAWAAWSFNYWITGEVPVSLFKNI